MTTYLTNTFSPMMLGPGATGKVFEVTLPRIHDDVEDLKAVSAISHEVTAKIVSALLDFEVPFNRVNLVLNPGDIVLCVIPNFRATEAREFTHDEVAAAGFRCFTIYVN